MDDTRNLIASPLPHFDRTARPNSWMRAICSTDGTYFSSNSLRLRARNSAGSLSKSSQPPEPAYAVAPVRISARVRSGRVAAKRIEAGPPSLTPKSAALSKPAASITASISAARSSSVRTFGTGSDNPTPALSNRMIRQKVPSLSMNAQNSGKDQYSSTWLAKDPLPDQFDGPVAEHLIGQAEVA